MGEQAAARGAALIGAALACALASSTGATAARTCSADGYAYAGLVSAAPARGVSATIGETAAPSLRSGHVAAWVGVGGEGLGRGGAAEWLQAGLSVRPNGASLYFEVQQRSGPTRYVMLRGHVPRSLRFRVSVVEAHAVPGAWEVWVNGAQMTRPLYLPGSHGRWRPMATAESWAATSGACNRFGFSFASVATATAGGWAPLEGQTMADPGLRIVRRPHDSFLAASTP